MVKITVQLIVSYNKYLFLQFLKNRQHCKQYKTEIKSIRATSPSYLRVPKTRKFLQQQNMFEYCTNNKLITTTEPLGARKQNNSVQFSIQFFKANGKADCGCKVTGLLSVVNRRWFTFASLLSVWSAGQRSFVSLFFYLSLLLGAFFPVFVLLF